MNEAFDLKFWQFLLLAFFAFYGLMQLIILPIVQKLIYRRFQATERKLDAELDFGLPSYALANRKLWIDRLINDPEVKKTLKSLAQDGDTPAPELLKQARDYADEIVPSFNAVLYFKFGYWLSKMFLRLFYWIKVGYSSQQSYDQITKNNCVVLVSNHRSNFDPFLLIYMASKRAPISYSAGRWALSFPFRQFLHAIGFYIVRSDRSSDKLYHALLKRYVFLATSQCVPQGLFLEGGLSRDGKMQPLQLGLLSYILNAQEHGTCEDIVFIPAALNYDRIPEFKTLISHEIEGFDNKNRFYSLLSFIRFFATVATYVLPRRHKPFGYSCVNFGAPISLKEWQDKNNAVLSTLSRAQRRTHIGQLGEQLADHIQNLIPILPTNILAQVIMDHQDTPLSEIELKMHATALIKTYLKDGVSVFLPKNDEDYALSQGIYTLIRENIIKPVGDGRFKFVSANKKLLAYYCNTKG